MATTTSKLSDHNDVTKLRNEPPSLVWLNWH